MLVISDRSTLPGQDLAPWLQALANAAPPAVLLREKDLPDRDLHRWARAAEACLSPATRLLVSGRPDLALAAGAAGVHLPAEGLPTARVRARWGSRLLLGRSTHRVSEVAREAAEGADYVTFGPVFDTPSKRPWGRPAGLAALAEACAIGIPVLALGGITLERLPAVLAAGAHGIAAIRLFQDIDSLIPTLTALGHRFAEEPFRP